MSGLRSCRNQRGSLLVVTLWVVAILAVFVVAIARYLSIELRLTRHRMSRDQAAAL
jgi:type II secretory pathway component PulK